MNKKDLPKRGKFKTILIFTIIILVVIGLFFAKKYFDRKRELEIGQIIQNAMSEESEKDQIVEEDEPQKEQTLIDKYEYSYDENNKFTVGIFKDEETDKLSVHAFCHYSDGNMGLMQDDFLYIWAYPYGEDIDISTIINVGEHSYSYLTSNGNLLLNDIPMEPLEEFPNEYIEKFEERRDGLINFYKENGIYTE